MKSLLFIYYFCGSGFHFYLYECCRFSILVIMGVDGFFIVIRSLLYSRFLMIFGIRVHALKYFLDFSNDP